MTAANTIRAAAVMVALALAPATAAADVGVFARIPDVPGLPEGITEAPDGTVYVGTNPGGNAPGAQNGTPSKIYAFKPDGTPIRDFTIAGQQTEQALLPAYGLQQLATDANGLIYALDKRPARVLTIDPATGRQGTYATFDDVPTCTQTANRQPCSATLEDAPAFPNYPAFAPDGAMIVSDFQQALLWRVPPGGGKAQVLLTDPRLENPMGGPNGLQFRPDGRTLVFTQSLSLPGLTTRLFEVQVDGNRAGPLRQFYESPPGDGGDGLALGQSGDVYLNSFTSNQIIRVATDGREVQRIRTGAGDEIQFDAPASSVFSGRHLLVTNQSVILRNPASFAVLDVPVGERGVPLFRPTPAGTRSRPGLRLRATRRPGARRLRIRGRVRHPGVRAAKACSGRVRLTVRVRSRVLRRTARLSPTCRFHAQVRARAQRRVRIRARFAGNRRLTPAVRRIVVRRGT